MEAGAAAAYYFATLQAAPPVPVFAAVAPLAVVSVVWTVVSAVISLVQTMLAVAKYIFCLAIFFSIAFYILDVEFNLFGGFDAFLWLARALNHDRNCVPLDLGRAMA